MMNILEYWENEYAILTSYLGFDEVYDAECKVFEMDDIDLVNWANARGIDLDATVIVGGVELPALEVWRWDFQ